MQKVLVNTNQIQAAAAVDQARANANTINVLLAPALESIGVGLTDEILKDCLNGAEALKAAYDKEVENDAKNIKNHVVRTQMRETAASAWKDLAQHIATAKRIVASPNHLQVLFGECCLSNENEKKIMESMAVYITDPKEIAAYELHLEIVKKLNQLFQGSVPFGWSVIFQEDRNGQIVRNDETNYSILVSRGK